MEAGNHDTADSKTRLLYIKDRKNGYAYLIDSGASVSVIPARPEDRINNDSTKSNLTAANGSKISTYGERLIQVNFNFSRVMNWAFVVADVQHPILGADFIYHFNLSLNLSQKSLIDNNTDKRIYGHFTTVDACNKIFCVVQENFKSILDKYSDLTSANVSKRSPIADQVKHCIPTVGKPCHSKSRPLAIKFQQPVKEALDEMLQEGIIRPSRSPWASPLHVVPKKDNTWRVVGDYRLLNSVTKNDSYSLPYLQDFSSNIHGMKIFSRLDLKSAFLQVEVNEEDIPKTAIATPFGNYEYTKMGYGLKSSSQSFQRYINCVLWNLETLTEPKRPVNNFVYIDDILIASKNETEHEQDLDALLHRLSMHGLKLNAHKCIFGASSLEFLGHKISSEGISPLQEKVEAVADFKCPEKVKGLRRFLGIINFYRKFIPHAAEHLAPLFDLIASHSHLKKCYFNMESSSSCCI